ncbi:hypothetical protein [Variovorax atrisoli]|uniref:hypothetical protein n=1 Tax=Variovorax atrisoli TaxID=3394203 RepID=UPI000372FEF2|nr:hypothetical protein [Variovorax paradoxus]
MSVATRWLIAAAIAFLVGASHLLDGPDECDTHTLVQADKADAIADAQRVARTGE